MDRGDHWCGEIVGERFSNFIMFASSLIMPLVFLHATVWYAQGASLVITNLKTKPLGAPFAMVPPSPFF